MIRFILLAVSIYSITVQSISCSSDPECASDPIYAAVAAQIATESAVCDTSISQCTITCNVVDPCIDTGLHAAVGFPLECSGGICVAAPTTDPTKSPSAFPSIPPSKNPSISPLPGTANPTAPSASPTASPSDVTSEPTLATSGPTPAPTCGTTGLCSCTDDAPCVAAYGAAAAGLGETPKCNDAICTVTCVTGAGACATVGSVVGTALECDTNVAPPVCIIPPSVSPTKAPTANPSTDPSRAPSKSPSASPSKNPTQPGGTLSPSNNPTASPTKAPTRSPTKSPTKLPSTSPTKFPSKSPSVGPTSNPTQPGATRNPSTSPTKSPTTNPIKACTLTTLQEGACTCVDSSNQPNCDGLNADPTVIGLFASVAPGETFGCYSGMCAPSCASGSCAGISAAFSTPLACENGFCVPATFNPSKSPSDNPTKNPSTSPTGNPTRTGVTNPPSKSPTKGPTANPVKAAETGNPSKSPTKSPTTNPVQTCGLTTIAAGACTCVDTTNQPNCDLLNADATIAAVLPAGESFSCDVTTHLCTVTCASNDCSSISALSGLTLGCSDGFCRPTTPDPTISPTDMPSQDPSVSPTESPTNVGDTRSPSKSPTMDPTISPTKSPTRSPTQRPTVSPTKSPTKSPTLRPTLQPSKPGDTRYPTKSPTPNPTKSPTKSPTSMPSTSPVEPCGLATFPAGACTCVDADTQPNCDILNADSTIQGLFASMDPPETIACDPLAEQCTVTCNTETTCATLSAMAGALFTEPLACDTDRNLCVIVQPTSSPTESPTDDNTDCLKDYYPYGADCAETEPEGCGLLFDATVDVCTLNMIFTQFRIGAIISGSVEEIVAGIATAKGICPAGVQQYILKSLAVNPRGNNAANAIARGNPQTAAACPALDDICKSENGGPGFELVAQVAVHCDTCEATKNVGQALVDGGIKTGDYNTAIEIYVNAMAASDDTVCEDGFGTVDIQSIDVVFVNLEGDQEVIVEDVGEDGAIQKYYAVAMTVVFMVCAWL